MNDWYKKDGWLSNGCDEREQMSLIDQMIDVAKQYFMVNVDIQVFLSHMVQQDSNFDLSEVKCDPLGPIS